MKQNVNHKAYFAEEKKESVPVAPVTGVVGSAIVMETPPAASSTREELMEMTKEEQVVLLKSIGLSRRDIKKLRYENDRVEALLWAGGD